jgi:uncharacterized protein (DUF58 family)
MKIRLIAIILPLLALALALVGGFALVWRFFLFLVVVLLLSYLWLRLSVRGIGGQVKETADHCQAGECIEEEFTVFNRGRLPVPLVEINEDTDLPGHRNTVAFSLSPQGSYSWRTRVRCQRRGRYRLGALKVRVTDPLGFFTWHCQIGESRNIVVYPATLALPFFEAMPRPNPGLGPRRRLVSEMGPNAARVRDYTSGDSLRYIHWHTTAHTGRLMVKEFDPDRTSYAFQDVWLVLDMHEASQQGEGDESTGEYGITITASLAEKYLDSGKRVGLLAAGERSYLFLPGTGDRHRHNIMNALALMRAAGKVPVDALLALEAERFNANSAVVVIAPSDNRGIVAPLHQAVNRGVMVIAVLLDSLSFGGGTDADGIARSLVSSGVTVYVVRQGLGIAWALDSRLDFSRVHFMGDEARKWMAAGKTG